MLEVCQYNLEQLKDPDHAVGGRYFDRDVDDAAGNIVSGLSLQRLIELENKTNVMLRSGQPVDGEFWDLVLKKIHVEKSIVRLVHPAGQRLLCAGKAQLHTRSCFEESIGAV